MSLTRWAFAALLLADRVSAAHKPKASSVQEDMQFQHDSKAVVEKVTAKDTRVTFHVGKLDGGSEGQFVVDIHPAWAPLGATRFLELVQNNFFSGAHFFRVIPGFMAQFGIAGDPAIAQQWQEKRLEDDPVRMKNKKGRVSFATAGQNSRTTQVFVNFHDNLWLDRQGFAPFAEVVEGMDVLEKLYGGYGEAEPYGKGPSQHLIEAEGAQYLEAHYPKLSVIKSVKLSRANASKALPFEITGGVQVSSIDRPDSIWPFILGFVSLSTIASGIACTRLDGGIKMQSFRQEFTWVKSL